ncbi:MATE family efflux transporter [Clostridium mediterraneense]|uniref:MATE family efflux transporter n=1 Tax=Clostridium mediterraneense TaxID=1805472 RepID=UPI00082A8096|nr:MATE family efflux transporter [Clostridium mediterraneense]
MEKVDLTKGNVFKVIVSLALPIMGTSFLQVAYGLIDMLWVGRLGSGAVAAVGTSNFFINLGYAINSLVIVGVGIKVAHSIGKKDDKQLKEYINIGMLLNGIIAVVYCAILIIFRKYLIDFFDLNNAALEQEARNYLLISAPMLFFSFYNFLFTRILGSFGNNKIALNISMLGLILNIILDPIFIYTFNMGVEGAAVATLISKLLMFIMFLMKKGSPFRYCRHLEVSMAKVVEIIKLGFPTASQRILFTLVSIVLARIIANFGADAIAAQKIGLQIETITLMIIGGLNRAISAYTGQNYGAEKFDRINEGYHKTLLIGIGYSLITSIIFLVIPKQIVSLFVSNQSTIESASNYLIIIGIAQIFSCLEVISNGVFTGLGIPKIPAVISITFTLSRLPIAMVLAKFLGVNGIWVSIAVTSALKGITAFLVYEFRVKKRCRLHLY